MTTKTAMQPEELKKIRQDLGLTQSELGRLLDVDRNTVTLWEAGVLNIRTVTELAIENIVSWSPQKIARRLRDSE